MTKIKHIVFIVLLAAVIAALVACNAPYSDIGEDTTTPTVPADTTTPADTTPADTTVPEDPLREEKSAIKQKVIALMTEDDRQSPTDLFEEFCGDYSIPYLSKHNDFGVSVNRIWQKDGVTAIEYANGNIEYTLVKEGYQFKLLTQNGQTELIAAAPAVTVGGMYIPSVFADFSIDITAIYKGNVQSDVSDPPLTEDMLTVSDDLATCTFSDEYMAAVIDMFLTEMGYADTERAQIAAKCSGSGKYTAEDNSVEFVLELNIPVMGEMKVTILQSDNENDGFRLSTITEYTVTAEGISIPTTNELSMFYVEYDGDVPVKATIRSRVLESGATITSNGVTYNVDSSNVSTFYLNKQTSEINVNIDQEINTTVAGQTISESMTVHLMLNEQKTLMYSMAQNHLQQAEVHGEQVVMSAPADAVVPQIVYDLADKAYYNIVG